MPKHAFASRHLFCRAKPCVRDVQSTAQRVRIDLLRLTDHPSPVLNLQALTSSTLLHRSTQIGMVLVVEGSPDHEHLYPRIEWGPPCSVRILWLSQPVTLSGLQGREGPEERLISLLLHGQRRPLPIHRGYAPFSQSDELLEYTLPVLMQCRPGGILRLVVLTRTLPWMQELAILALRCQLLVDVFTDDPSTVRRTCFPPEWCDRCLGSLCGW